MSIPGAIRSSAKLCARKPVTIAVGQMCSSSDRAANLASVTSLADAAVAKNASMLFIPENFHYMGESSKASLAIAEPLSGPALQSYRAIAKERKLWLSLGGFQEKFNDTHVYNTHVIVNDEGEIVQHYRKIHMFDYGNLKESSFTAPGTDLAVADTPAGVLGLSVCYDVRFPALYGSLRAAGSEIIAVPAAFTYRTGVAHWTALLRARAIETQCYIVAAAQTGMHNPPQSPKQQPVSRSPSSEALSGSAPSVVPAPSSPARTPRPPRESYGHACIVDPWGQVVAEVSERASGIAVAEIDLEMLGQIRKSMPIIEHGRPDAYTNAYLSRATHFLQEQQCCDAARPQMTITELRIPLPFSLTEYQLGYIYSRNKFRAVAPARRSSTKLVQCTPYSRSTGQPLRSEAQFAQAQSNGVQTQPAENHASSSDSGATGSALSSPSAASGMGIFTTHSHSFTGFLPSWALSVVGSPSISVDGHAWDEFPHIQMRYDLPSLGVASARAHLSFIHIDNDRGRTQNAFSLSPTQLRERRVQNLDISADPSIAEAVAEGNLAADPATFITPPLPTSGNPADLSPSSGGTAPVAPRGPFPAGAWLQALPTSAPSCCVYVLLRVDLSLPFPLLPLRARAEDLIASRVADAVWELHRLAVVWASEWYPGAAPAVTAATADSVASDETTSNTPSAGPAVVTAEEAARLRALYSSPAGTEGVVHWNMRVPPRPPLPGSAAASAVSGSGAVAGGAEKRGARGLGALRGRLQARL